MPDKTKWHTVEIYKTINIGSDDKKTNSYNMAAYNIFFSFGSKQYCRARGIILYQESVSASK